MYENDENQYENTINHQHKVPYLRSSAVQSTNLLLHGAKFHSNNELRL